MFRASKVFVFSVVTTTLVACSGGVVDVGATDSSKQDLKHKADGGASGDGSTCSTDGVMWSDAQTGATGSSGATTYKVGDSFPSPDGCNTCSCNAQGIVCTERACAPVDGGSAPVCTYDHKSYAAGAKFPSTDGCNSCGCLTTGEVVCTELDCAYACPPEKSIDCMPVVPAEDQAMCSGPYHDWIAKNCPGVVFAM